MVVLEIYTKYLAVKYKTTFFSKATLFVAITTWIKYFVPFILAYQSGGFWTKRDVFYEQPNVKFKGEYLFYGTTTNLNQPVVCTNNKLYAEYVGDFDSCPAIKVREIDNNLDAKTDELLFILEINLRHSLTFFNLIVPLEYKLHTVCPLTMESAIIVQNFLPPQTSKVSITGKLQIFQAHPLHCKKKNKPIILDDPVINSIKPDLIIEKYSQRNISTYITNVYTNYKTIKTEIFTIEFKVQYPEHKVLYKPKFWQIIKWAWVQYIAVYIVIHWLLSKFQKYIFDNKLVLYYEESPLKLNNKKL